MNKHIIILTLLFFQPALHASAKKSQTQTSPKNFIKKHIGKIVFGVTAVGVLMYALCTGAKKVSNDTHDDTNHKQKDGTAELAPEVQEVFTNAATNGTFTSKEICILMEQGIDPLIIGFSHMRDNNQELSFAGLSEGNVNKLQDWAAIQKNDSLSLYYEYDALAKAATTVSGDGDGSPLQALLIQKDSIVENYYMHISRIFFPQIFVPGKSDEQIQKEIGENRSKLKPGHFFELCFATLDTFGLAVLCECISATGEINDGPLSRLSRAVNNLK